ncbi:MAG: bifunctional riboflavin kinase/FAD synthetase [Armatimonadota bacterium]|nr:bifunctional riboflavin kinase/FAD synthetase [Armatimonadota bacterium]
MSWTLSIDGLQNAFPEGCAVAIGVFDGVHKGHQALLHATTRWARAHGVPAVVLTFEPHPAAVLAPAHSPPLLCTLAHRIERLRALGIDWVVVQPFTPAFSQLTAEQFIHEILIQRLNTRAVVVGGDFRFGHKRGGSVETLRAAGAFEVVLVAEVTDAQGERISSTRIRELVRTGAIEQANALLGEPLPWTGVVVHGDQRGRKLGYPTANLVPIAPLVMPAEGVYACQVQVENVSYAAAVSVGKPPMFENARGRVEAYLIDFPDTDLYGQVLTLQFLKRLRPLQVFESIDALQRQMARDVEQARLIAQEVATAG